MPDVPKEPGTFESWAIVEIMGHQRLAGLVSEQTIAGTALLRVDVPELPETVEEYRTYDYDADPPDEATKKRVIPGVPGFTTYVGGGSIYRLTPCTEETARRAVAKFRERPITCVDLAPPPRGLLPATANGAEDDAAADDDDDHHD